MPSPAENFILGTPAGVSNVTRDAAGRLLSWVENGYLMTVRRDSAGKPLTLVAAGTQSAGRLVQNYKYDSSGRLAAIVGDRILTQFARELVWVAGTPLGVDPVTGLVVTGDGGILAVSEVTPYVNMTATGIAFTGACELAGFDCTVAAGNITIYDGTSAAGTVIVPATALTAGLSQWTFKRALTTGCYVVLSGAATVNVLVGA